MRPAFGYRRQGGMVLATGLIFLLLMTMIGVASIQTTSLDERMAGNLRDRNLAFQSAESALRDGEDNVMNAPSPQLKTLVTDQTPDPNDDDGWSDELQLADAMEDVYARPIYVIEELLDLSSALEFNDLGGLYRVTSRGLGSTNTAVVVLQTTVGRGVVDDP